MSPTGRRIHETVFRRAGLTSPVRIGILETPTGYEVNAIHGWPERMEQFFVRRLGNYKPSVKRIRAWRRDGVNSTNDSTITDAILAQDYLYCGAGSPGYTIRHLRGSRAWKNLTAAHEEGTVLCLGSATAVAVGAWALPVYEIFKAGADIHWLAGLDLFSRWGLSLAIIPHWNNTEGEDFDTTRCWMGKERFNVLRTMLPGSTTILGIDEQTACVCNLQDHCFEVLGKGHVFVMKGDTRMSYASGDRIGFEYL